MKYEFQNKRKTPVLIGAHCSEPFKKNKLEHFKFLLESLKSNNFFICVVCSSSLPRDMIDLCDLYIETANYTTPHYGVTVSMQTEIGLNLLKYHMFNSCLRLEYDSPINFNYVGLIEKFQSICEINNKKFISANWGQHGIGTGNFYLNDIDFLLRNVRFFSFKTGHENYTGILENIFKNDLIKSNCIQHCHIYGDYNLFYENKANPQKYQGGGNIEIY